MDYRHLGRSGLMVSEIAYGNWITHGDQVEEQAAADCVRAALDEGITTFDTADAYAGGRAEEVLGRALHGVRRESVEIFTKVYWPTGDRPNDRGLSRKHVTESLHASLRRLRRISDASMTMITISTRTSGEMNSCAALFLRKTAASSTTSMYM